jgi:hypothetical protein
LASKDAIAIHVVIDVVLLAPCGHRCKMFGRTALAVAGEDRVAAALQGGF